MSVFIDQAVTVLREHGLDVDAASLDTSGTLTRCAVIGKNGNNKDGAYWVRLDARPTTWWENFPAGDSGAWSGDGEPARLTDAERAEIDQLRRNREAEQLKVHEHTAKAAQAQYNNASKGQVQDHGYAKRKAVDFGPHVRRFMGGGKADFLLVPAYDKSAKLWTLQRIADGKAFGGGERDKDFLKDGRIGGCFCPVGASFRNAAKVLIGEGLATVAAAVQATGLPGVVAFDAGNLSAVAKVVREMAATGADLIILADDDQKPGTPKNPGVEAANKAAQAIGGRVALPGMGKKADFWDVLNELGADVVRERIGVAVAETVKPKLRALRRDDLIALDDIDWLIKGVMPARGVGVVFGPSTVGKSFLEVDKAAALAEGREWFGCRVKQRPVVYACLEGQHGFKRRVMAWEAHHGRRYPNSVVFAPDPIDLRSEQDTAALIELTQREAGPGAVVIVDTLNRAAPGMEENGSVDYGLILASAGRIEQAVEGFVCFVGHPGKDASKGLRGHYSMFAGLDMVLEVEEVNKAELSFAWVIRKAKDGQDGIKRHFKREVVDLFEDADGDLVSSCVVVPDPEQDQGGKARPAVMTPKDAERFEAFRQAAMEHGTLDHAGQFIGLDPALWRSAFYEQNVDATADTKSKAFRRIKNGLVNSGWIVETLGGLLLPTGPGAETHVQIITDAISERTRTPGQVPDKSRTSPVPEPCLTPDGPDTPYIKGVRLSGPVSGVNNETPLSPGTSQIVEGIL
jgi:phage/plasmid primase-like uncharacterized protein